MVYAHSSDALCCCEYYDHRGQRSHILACCCDCEAVDLVCDRLLTCHRVDPYLYAAMWQTVIDRLRLPSLTGKGAVQVHPDVAVPLVVVPLGILLATINEYFTGLCLVALPVSILVHYQLWNQSQVKTKSRVFYIWGLTSAVMMFTVFIGVVIGFRKIFLWEIMLEVTFYGVLMYYLYEIRRDPGVIPRPKSQTGPGETHVDMEGGDPPLDKLSSMLVNNFGFDEQDLKTEVRQNLERQDQPVVTERDVTWVDSRPFAGGELVTWCRSCQVKKVARSGHCTVCNACIYGRDHHCVWVDTCIGASNHRAFFLGLVFLQLSGMYGAHLTLTTVCTPSMYLDWFLLPTNCHYVYADFPTALSFVAACYTLIFCMLMLVVLIQQAIFISQNVTSQEMAHAAARGWTLCVMWAQHNLNNRGVLTNWRDFLTGRRQRRHRYGSLDI